jgi:hypothetical protein
MVSVEEAVYTGIDYISSCMCTLPGLFEDEVGAEVSMASGRSE